MENKWLRRIVTGSLAIAALGISLGEVPATATTMSYIEGRDAAAPFYDPTVVNRVDLIVPQSSIQTINDEFDHRTDPTNFTYVPAQIKITTASATYGPLDVEIHLKGGWGSLTPLSGKAGFKVKINSTGHKSQRILGLKKLTFNNAVQDGTYVHEATAYRLFRNVGVPAPRVGYVRIFMNCAQDMNPEPGTTCQDYGLHPNIETMDEIALARWVNGTTHLYEGGTPYFPDMYDGAVFQTDLGNSANNSDFKEFARINQLSGAAWYNEMIKRTDLKEMTLDWATENYVGHWDGYATNTNNYYLHSDATGKFRMFPWGTDQTWGGLQDLYAGGGGKLLLAKCNAYAPCRAMYTDSLVTIWNKARAIQLIDMPRDIYDGILASDMGPQTDPFGRVCDSNCAAGVVDSMRGFISTRDNQVSPIANELALTRPTLSVKLAPSTITATWIATKVPGIAITGYVVQRSSNGSTWTTLTPDSLTKTTIRNTTAGSISYFRVRVITSNGTSPWSTAIRVRAI